MKAKNPNAKLFRIYDQGNNVTSNTRASDKYIQNAAYLRVKISLWHIASLKTGYKRLL